MRFPAIPAAFMSHLSSMTMRHKAPNGAPAQAKTWVGGEGTSATRAARQFQLWPSPLHSTQRVKLVSTWRITLRPCMVATNQPLDKVFSSVTAFDGYVHELRERGVAVSFSTPFTAAVCKVTA